MEIGEKVEDACKREMKEEISLDVEIQALLGVYSDPKRDECFHTVSVVYLCKAYGIPKGADDAKKAMVVKLEDLKTHKLAFDHGSRFIRNNLNG